MVAGGIVMLAVLSCRGEPAVIARQTEVADSAGVTLVSLTGDLAGYAVPNLELKRSYRIGTDDSGIELYRVAGARFMESGQLVVANSGSQEIVIADSTGRLSHRFGGKGEGPGQFSSITSVHIGADGTIVAYDDSQGRLSEFDASGRLLSTRRMTDPSPISDLIPLMVSMRGAALAVNGDNRHFGKPGTVRRDTTPLFRFDPASLEPDTVSLWPAKSWSFGKVGMGTTRAQPAFGPDLLSAGNRDHVALADTHDSEVTVLDSEGAPTMTVRWSEPDVPDSDAETWRRERAKKLSGDLPKELRTQLLDVPRFRTKPHVRGRSRTRRRPMDCSRRVGFRQRAEVDPDWPGWQDQGRRIASRGFSDTGRHFAIPSSP